MVHASGGEDGGTSSKSMMKLNAWGVNCTEEVDGQLYGVARIA
jgi:hypothetical protein